MDVAALDRGVEKAFVRTLSTIWRRKLVFLLTGLTVFSALVLGILRLEPMFEGSTQLITGNSGLEVSSPNARQATESPQTLVRIAESDEVMRRALGAIGLERVAPRVDPRRESIFQTLRQQIFGVTRQPSENGDPAGAVITQLRPRLRIRAEPTSGVISISFRHEDAGISSEFANAAARAFIDRQIALYSRPGAVEFFRDQQRRFDQEFATASDGLERFSRTTGVFAADEQRDLLLRRLNELNSSLALTRNTIAEKLGQRQALADQLRRLAPVARSSYVSSLVDSLGGDRVGPPGRAAGEARSVEERSGDPPLLLVRVYQDSMVSLFRINGELQGAQNGQTQLQEEQTRITAELNRLAQAAEEFARLRRAVNQAAANSDLNARRMVEEQINAELTAARFSSVQVLQPAARPLRPVFPNYIVAVGASAAAALVAAIAVALLADFFLGRRVRSRSQSASA